MKNLKNKILVIVLLLTINSSYSQIDVYGNYSKSKLQSHSLELQNTTDSLLHIIPSPTTSTNGITFDGENLWVSSVGPILYMISPIDGAVKKELNTNMSYITGITFVEPNIWVVDMYNKRICKIDTTSGYILDYFYIPAYGSNGFPSGLTWDGNYLWYNSGGMNDSTYKLDLSGEVISRFASYNGAATGLTFDGSNLWSINAEFDIIYQISLPDFILLDSLNAPGGQAANGLAFDNQYLWVSNNESDSIYKLDIGLSSINTKYLVDEQIKVWPIPTHDLLNIKIINADIIIERIEIYSISGRLEENTYRKTDRLDNLIEIDLINLKTGVYFLIIYSKEGLFHRTIVKQK